MKTKLLTFLCLIFLWCGTVLAKDAVFPPYGGFVNDFAGVLDPAMIKKMGELSYVLEQETSAELVVVTIKTTAPLDPKEYAVKLFKEWKIGKAGKDNGILILLSTDEQRVEIEVGYGLEGTVNDAKAGEIIDN
ncbi:TPM domain-containing protein, partial [Candidatus Saganbacteria bacterium]|nr:TPM domain-containing protein [Candidatus Saganbacteria bacterium]